MPKFSILLITYNQEEYIQETLNSLLKQTYDDFEIILSDDCSTDNTINKAKEINDSRIKIFSTPFNMGINGNINNAAEKASGEYVILLGGDDKLRPNYLKKLDEILSKESISVIYPLLTIINGNGEYKVNENYCFFDYENIPRETLLHDLFLIGNRLPSPGMCIEFKAFKSILPLDYSLILFQDYKIHVELAVKGYKFLILDEIFVDYRRFDDGRNISNFDDVEITQKRFELETDNLMNSFLEIKDLNLLNNIFAKEILTTKISPDEKNIPFFLGQMALLSEDKAKKDWGYKQIAKFIKNVENYKLVYDKYDFKFKNFLNLAKTTIVSNKYKLKYKRYKKYFNVVLVILIIVLVLLLSITTFVLYNGLYH